MPSNLDQELAHAIGLAGEARTPEGVSAPVPATAPGEAAAARPRSSNLGLLATLLVMAGALVAMFFLGFKEAAIYALPVDQLMAAGDKHVGRRVRVEGELVPGSLAKRDQPCEYRFTIHGGASQVPVRYASCILADSVRDVPQGGVQMTVEGQLKKEGHFEATLVMAKCTSKYDAKTHTMARPEGAATPAPPDESEIVR